MSWEVEKELGRRPGANRPAGSPFIVVGFAVGVMAVGPFAYFWLYAWAVPLLLAGLFATVARFAGRQSQRFWHLAEGALAATVFSMTFALVGLVSVLAFTR